MARRSMPTASQLHRDKWGDLARRVGVGLSHEDGAASPPDDGAVLACILKQFWGYDGTWDQAPILHVVGDGWTPLDLNRWGLSFYDGPPIPRSAPRSERRIGYSFFKPRYDGGGALVETGVSFGFSGGYSARCRVRVDGDGWYVDGARITGMS